MKTPICEMLGIEFPLLAFTHCRDVVVAVSKAGGMGVFGAVRYTPEQLEEELAWIDAHIDGMPYGVDLIVPSKAEGREAGTTADMMLGMLPEEHKSFANALLNEHGIEGAVLDDYRHNTLRTTENMRNADATEMLDVAFAHPIKLIANALGVPPQTMLDYGKARGVPVAALVGAKEHAIAQVSAGVDILVAAGGEAGGHCGEVSTMVLIPEVCEAIKPVREVPVLAAGGIVTGRQMAAAMAMGADGAWCGSVWLTTPEAEPIPVVKEKLLAASSRDTVRSRCRTGKPSRQLRSPFTDAWETEDAPQPLPMPLQSLVAEPAMAHVNKLAQSGHQGAMDLASYWVGQGVGLMNREMSAGAVVQEFKEDFIRAYERLTDQIGE